MGAKMDPVLPCRKAVEIVASKVAPYTGDPFMFDYSEGPTGIYSDHRVKDDSLAQALHQILDTVVPVLRLGMAAVLHPQHCRQIRRRRRTASPSSSMPSPVRTLRLPTAWKSDAKYGTSTGPSGCCRADIAIWKCIRRICLQRSDQSALLLAYLRERQVVLLCEARHEY